MPGPNPNPVPKSPPPAVATRAAHAPDCPCATCRPSGRLRQIEWTFDMHAIVQLKHDADPAALAGYVVAREIYESPAGPAEYAFVRWIYRDGTNEKEAQRLSVTELKLRS